MGSFIADYSDFYEYMSKYTWEGMHEPGGCMICLYSQHLGDSDGWISVNSRPAWYRKRVPGILKCPNYLKRKWIRTAEEPSQPHSQQYAMTTSSQNMGQTVQEWDVCFQLRVVDRGFSVLPEQFFCPAAVQHKKTHTEVYINYKQVGLLDQAILLTNSYIFTHNSCLC